MTTKPPIPKWAVQPPQWGARVNCNLWTDPYVPKTEIAVHYGGGPNTAGNITGTWVTPPIPKPGWWKAPWKWWRWREAGGYALQRANEMAVLRGWERYHIDSRGWRALAYSV